MAYDMHTDSRLEPLKLKTLKLGELYWQACKAIKCPPQNELMEAFNSDDPKEALIKLIVGGVSALAEAPEITTALTPSAEAELDPKRQKFGPDTDADNSTKDHDGRHIDNLSAKRDLDMIWYRAEASHQGSGVSRWIQAIAQMFTHGAAAQTYSERAQDRLIQALEEESFPATQRQEHRRAQRGLDRSQIDAMVRKKLDMPAVTLSNTESRDCLVSCIENGKIHAKQAEEKNIIVILGNTGAGKSAFINLLHGCKFELNPDDKMVVSADSDVKELMKIGHTNKSETFAPQVEEANSSFGEGYAFADCPGFLDNRGFEINVANAVNVRQTMAAAAKVVVVAIINYHSLLADRGKGVKDLFQILSALFGTIENVKKHSESIILAISQAPVMHPETGQAMSLKQHKERLLDPSGLDEKARELLETLGNAKAIIYHLLGRGDASWLDRNSIIASIKELVPIIEPKSLFQSAINDADKESLRDLVDKHGKKLKAFLSAEDYDSAVDVASNLLELKLVAHSFVTSIVEETIDDAIRNKMTTVKEYLDAQYDPGDDSIDVGSNGAMLDAEKIDHARRQLQSMSSMIIAFAGIEDVRNKLTSLVIEASCQCEVLVKAVAENAGQKEVEDSLMELLREVGDNIVREVIELPKAAEAMKVKHREEELRLERLLNEESSALPHLARQKDIRAAKEQNVTDLRELSYRSAAANARWQLHIDHSLTKLEQRDEQLLVEEGPAFWGKLGLSNPTLGPKSIPQDWEMMRPLHRGQRCTAKLTDRDCEIMATVFRKLGGPASVTKLYLNSHAFGVFGISALSDATAFGALANLETLFINNNEMGDSGLVELCKAMDNGAWSKLTFLDMNSNGIGDLGVTALARTIAGGGLANLETLYLYCNKIGDAGMVSFVGSLASAASLANLKQLGLNDNMIGDIGVKALSDAISKGMLASLRSVPLERNLANSAKVLVVMEQLKKPAS